MKIATFYQDEDEGFLYPTGETTSVSATDAVDVVEKLIGCLLSDCGRHEEKDYEGAERVLRKVGVIVKGSYDEEDEALADHEGWS